MTQAGRYADGSQGVLTGMRTVTCMTLFASAALLGACGGSDNGGGGGTCTPGPTTAVTITSAGVTPKAVCVRPTGTVTFTNNDTANHDIRHSGTTCTELDLGVIAPSGSATATLPTAAICQYHDALSPANAAFQGIVAVTTGQVGGPGY